jgi:hypothetical protein
MGVHRPKKFTLLKGIKLAIAVGPIAGVMASDVAASPNATGLKNAVGDLTKAYTGYDVATNTFQWSGLALGYVPLAGAWAFGKIASRVIR